MNPVLRSPEFRLLAACCRPRDLPDFLSLVRERGATPIDARKLLTLARNHRVEGFVEDALSKAGVRLPALDQQLLGARAAQARAQMLRNAAEEIRISRVFSAGGVDPVFVKGATIAMLAHGTLSLKSSWDIDVLVPAESLSKARTLLADAGYRLDLPGIEEPSLIDTYFLRNKETVWINAHRGTALELHSALVDFPAMLPGVGPASPLQAVPIGAGTSLMTLAPHELVAYLVVHGTAHSWERLKWLTDVAALIAKGSADEFMAAATHLGAGRSVATALHLCEHLLDMPRPQAKTESSTATDWLIRFSLASIANCGTFDPDSMQGFWSETIKLAGKSAMVKGPVAKLSAIMTLLRLSTVQERLIVPRALLPPHALLWIPYRLLTRLQRGRQARAGKTASTP